MESPIPAIPVQKSLLEEGFGEMSVVDTRIDVSVRDEDVLPAVVIDIKEGRSPPQVLGVHRQVGADGLVAEKHLAFVAIQGMGVTGEVRLEEIEVAVPVVVAGGDSHARLFHAVEVVGRARNHAHFFECPVFLVVVEK